MSRQLAAFAPFRFFVVALFGVAAPVSALQYNIDLEYGEPSPDNYGNPSSDYAAAAPTGGEWNSVSSEIDQAQAVVDDSGLSSGVTVTVANDVGGRRWDTPSTTGDDQALLDDGLMVTTDSSLPGTITVSSLPPGLWDVYTYAWDSSQADERSVFIDVNGTGSVLVDPSSDIFSGFSIGETHAVHSVAIGAGEDLVITGVASDEEFWDRVAINGVQIVAIDVSPVAPKSWGTLKSDFGD